MIDFDWCKRAGMAFVIGRECWINLDTLKHYRGFYIQIGNYGGHIGLESKVCYEN